MLRKFAAAVIAVSLIAGPAFAQGVLQPTPKGPAAKVETKADTRAVTTGVKIKETGAVTTPARKHVTVVKHNHKHVRHYAHGKRHYVHVKKVKHVHHVKAKHSRHIVKM
jgi:hypothetical protein